MLGVVVFCVLALAAFGDDKFPGPCPNVSPLADFDVEKFSERSWTLVESSDDKSKRCIKYKFETEPTKTWTVTGINKKGVEFKKVNSYTENEGNITAIEEDGDKEFYLVIAGDYANYTVFYQCEEKKNNMHEEDVLVLVSEESLTDLTTLLPHVHEVLKNTTLSVQTFHTISHDCTLNPTTPKP